MRSGRRPWRSASARPGRARPAAHPHTEFTTTISVPLVSWTAASTSADVRSSSTPSAVNSARIGATKNSGYGMPLFYLRRGQIWTPRRHFPGDGVAFETPVQGAPADAEHLGRPHPVPADLVQHVHDVLTFEIAKRS